MFSSKYLIPCNIHDEQPDSFFFKVYEILKAPVADASQISYGTYLLEIITKFGRALVGIDERHLEVAKNQLSNAA